MRQKSLVTGKFRSIARLTPRCSDLYGFYEHTSMIARQREGHDSVMVIATASKRSRLKWWLASGTQVFAAMEPSTYGYVQIFPAPDITECWNYSGHPLPHWPHPFGYVKEHNLTTVEAWAMGETDEPVMAPIMDVSDNTFMIARQREGHSSVMIAGTASNRSGIRWWLKSGTMVLATLDSDTNGYVKVSPHPSMTQCLGPSWQSWSQWPQGSGFIKRYNLSTLEAWDQAEHPDTGPLAIMDVDRGVWS